MKTQKIQEIKDLLSGEPLSGDCVPLFWEKIGDFYTAEGTNIKLTEPQFQKLNSKYPCYL